MQTLYAAFGTKANLLKHAIDVALAGDRLPCRWQNAISSSR